MSLKNFLPLRREVMEHWIYKDSDYFKVWVDMLFRARFSEEPKKDIYEGSLYTINQGEFLYSRPKWSLRLNIKDHKLKKLIKMLTDEEMIVKVGRVGKSGATIYSIKNYKKYNNYTTETPALTVDTTSLESDSGQPKANQTPAKDQRKTSQTPLKNNVNKEKNEYIVFFEECWKEYPSKKGKGQISDTKKKEVYKLGDEFKRCLTRYKKYVESENWLKYQNGSTFFNSGYVDYLDANYKQEQSDTNKLNLMDLSQYEVNYAE